jgi:hypothetical protein
MGSETTKKLILSNATAIIVNKMPSETNSSDDNNQHHVQFSKKTEVIPVNIIENNAKMSDIVDDEDNNQKYSQNHDTEQKLPELKKMVPIKYIFAFCQRNRNVDVLYNHQYVVFLQSL